MVGYGMEYEETLKQADWSNRGIVDAAVYAIPINAYKG